MNSLKKLFILLLAAVLITSAYFLFLFIRRGMPGQNSHSSPGRNIPLGNNVSSQQPASDSFQIEKQTEYSFDFLNNHAEILSKVREIKNDFQVDDIGTSLPSATAQLKNGKKYWLLSGCQSHNCGGTQIVIAYNEEDGNTYLLVENFDTKEGYEFQGNPPEEIRNLLAYYYLKG